MNEHLFIVIYRHGEAQWEGKTNGVFGSRRLAENFVECAKASGFSGELAIVEGTILTAETEEEATARLGKF